MNQISWLLIALALCAASVHAASFKQGVPYYIILKGGRDACSSDPEFLGFYNRTCDRFVGPALRSESVAKTWRQFVFTLNGQDKDGNDLVYAKTYYPSDKNARCIGNIVTAAGSKCTNEASTIPTIKAEGGSTLRLVPVKDDDSFRIILNFRKGGCNRFLTASSTCTDTAPTWGINDIGPLSRWVIKEVNPSASPSPSPVAPTPVAPSPASPIVPQPSPVQPSPQVPASPVPSPAVAPSPVPAALSPIPASPCDGLGEIVDDQGRCICNSTEGFESNGTGGCRCNATDNLVVGAGGVCVCNADKHFVLQCEKCVCDADGGWTALGSNDCQCDDSNNFELSIDQKSCVCKEDYEFNADTKVCDAASGWPKLASSINVTSKPVDPVVLGLKAINNEQNVFLVFNTDLNNDTYSYQFDAVAKAFVPYQTADGLVVEASRYPQLVWSEEDGLTIVFMESATLSANTIYSTSFGGSGWVLPGDVLGNTATQLDVDQFDTDAYIVSFSDEPISGEASAVTVTSNGIVYLGNRGFSSSIATNPRVAMCPGQNPDAYVVWKDVNGALRLAKCPGGASCSWQSVDIAAFTTSEIYDYDIACNDQGVYIVFSEVDDCVGTAIGYFLTSGGQLLTTLPNVPKTYVKIAATPGQIFVAFTVPDAVSGKKKIFCQKLTSMGLEDIGPGGQVSTDFEDVAEPFDLKIDSTGSPYVAYYSDGALHVRYFLQPLD